MRKFLSFIVLVPLAALLVMFAIANRHIVTVSFDPFSSTNPAFALTGPLFIVVFVLVGIGVIVGGAAAWLKQRKWRARARRAEAEVRAVRAAIEAKSPHADAPPPTEVSRFAVPPAA